MAAEYYTAECENGRRSADPSEDHLFMLIEKLDHADNTHPVIEPADESMTWYAWSACSTTVCTRWSTATRATASTR